MMMMMVVVMMFLFVFYDDFSSQYSGGRQINIGFKWVRVKGFVKQHVAKNLSTVVGNFGLKKEKIVVDLGFKKYW